MPGPASLLLHLPLAGQPGADWVVQNHVDLDPSAAVRDLTGHGFTYDGHQGTDFRIRGLSAMVEGVPALAPAGGVVTAVRDGQADRCGSGQAAVVPPGLMCGNGVVIDHGDGWETQLCHLRRGSVTVEVGQSVAAGRPVGLVGWSGNAEFPHLHLSVRKDGATVDPFLGPDPAAPVPMWASPPPPVADAVVWEVGFATTADVTATLLDRLDPAPRTLPSDSPAITAYVYGITNRPGDLWRLAVESPTGRRIAREARIDSRATAVRVVGKRRREGQRLDVGTWRASLEVEREGEVVTRRLWTVEVVEGRAGEVRGEVLWEGCAGE